MRVRRNHRAIRETVSGIRILRRWGNKGDLRLQYGERSAM